MISRGLLSTACFLWGIDLFAPVQTYAATPDQLYQIWATEEVEQPAAAQEEAAKAAAEYLRSSPSGPHAGELRQWLNAYNRIAQSHPEFGLPVVAVGATSEEGPSDNAPQPALLPGSVPQKHEPLSLQSTLAIPDLVAAQPDDAAVGQQIAGVIRADLDRSGMRVLDSASFIEPIKDPNAVPDFTNWRGINAQALVPGSVTSNPDGSLQVDFRLWDVFAASEVGQGKQYHTVATNWRRIAHIISDEIYERITGEKGYFDTRIVFISESDNKKRLAIMDEDGANPTFLTDGDYLVLTPRFNPTAQMIAYMSYFDSKPRVYLFDLETGQQQTLGDFSAMTSWPRFSPLGDEIAFSMGDNGKSDIYKMNLTTHSVTQLTNAQAADTCPSYSPDGKQIAFESDRSGAEGIFVMDADGSNVHAVGASEGQMPAWSPRGDSIAYSKPSGTDSRIAVMGVDGSGDRVVSSGSDDTAPDWAPNGRVVMFARKSADGQSQLWSVDAAGGSERLVPTPAGASDPDWSPLAE